MVSLPKLGKIISPAFPLTKHQIHGHFIIHLHKKARSSHRHEHRYFGVRLYWT